MIRAPASVIRLFGALALASLLGGCAHHRVDPKTAGTAAGSTLGEEYQATKRANVPLYRSGPQQVTAADDLLPKDTVARVVRRSFGYSLVQTEGGLLGWVPSEDLVAATVAAPALATAEVLLPPPAGGSSINATDAMNATAVATALPEEGPAGSAAGDTAIVAHYRLDDPSATSIPGARPLGGAPERPAKP